MAFIGIDLGTTFLKGAVLNTRTLRPEGVEREPFPEAVGGLPALFSEYDPAVIVERARALLEKLAAKVPECEGILWTTQMHGMVLVDEKGRARSNALNWLDQRVNLPHPSGAGSFFDVMMSRLTADEIVELGGTELRPGMPAGSLFWMKEMGKLPAEKVMPVALADYVAATLGDFRPVTELTNAHAHGLLNIRTLEWHRPIIEKLGLGGLDFPEIRRQGEVIGQVELSGKRVAMYTPVGDFQCAAAGALLEKDELWLNISTGSQVSRWMDAPELGPFQTRPFFDGKYLATVTTIPAGRALNSLVRLFCEMAEADGHSIVDPWEYIGRAVAKVGDPAMRANIAFFAGAMGDRGSLENMREEEMTVGHVFRAAFASMAENYVQCASRLKVFSDARRLVFSGGLVRKMEVLREMIRGRFGMPYRFCPVEEDTMLGLMVLGLAFSGKAGSVAEAGAQVRSSF